MVFAVPAMACCYLNKDVHNNTGQPAWDFKIVLAGRQRVEWHYDGYPDDYRFTQFDIDSSGVNTVLRWTQPVNPGGVPDSIPPCRWVHIGYKTVKPAQILVSCWTDKLGNCINRFGRIPVKQATHDFAWSNYVDRQVILRIFNYLNPNDTLKIENIYYAVRNSEVPLDQLNRRNLTLAGELQLLSAGPYVIGPTESHGHSVILTLPVQVQPGQFVVVRFEGADSTFADTAFVDFGQHEMEALAGVPTMSRWGVIALVLSLLAVGVILIMRRKRISLA